MKMVASYLEKAIDLEIWSADEPDPKLKASLLQIVAAYRKLAHERAARLKAQPSPRSNETRTPRAGTGHIMQRGAERPSLCTPFPSQGVPARGRVIIRNADNAITAALGRAA